MLDKLKQIADELRLQAHLFNKEAEDRWHHLEQRLTILEQKLVDITQEIGEREEHEMLGSNEEIEQLIEAFEDLRDKQKKK